jgi:hypothetical protein
VVRGAVVVSVAGGGVVFVTFGFRGAQATVAASSATHTIWYVLDLLMFIAQPRRLDPIVKPASRRRQAVTELARPAISSATMKVSDCCQSL